MLMYISHMRTKEKYEIYKPKKFLGQNFLVDDNISKKIVNYLDIEKDDNVVEIGQGALTKYLSGLTKYYIAVEIDKNIVEALKIKYKDSVGIIHKDFLKLDFEKDLLNLFNKNKKIKVIGNLPYNISSEILFKLFDIQNNLDFAIIMLQKEFALRMIAKPDTKEYGILAVQTQLNSVPKVLFSIPPTAFFPKPKVISSVVKLDFNFQTHEINDKKLLRNIIRSSFGKRRKIMGNSLKDLFSELNINFADINFDFKRRPENVKVEEFVNLSNEIFIQKTINKN